MSAPAAGGDAPVRLLAVADMGQAEVSGTLQRHAGSALHLIHAL